MWCGLSTPSVQFIEKDLLADIFAARRIFDVTYNDLCRICNNARVLRKVLRSFSHHGKQCVNSVSHRTFVVQHSGSAYVIDLCGTELRTSFTWLCGYESPRSLWWCVVAWEWNCSRPQWIAPSRCTQLMDEQWAPSFYSDDAAWTPPLCFPVLRCTQLVIALLKLQWRHFDSSTCWTCSFHCEGALHASAKKHVFYGHMWPNFDCNERHEAFHGVVSFTYIPIRKHERNCG